MLSTSLPSKYSIPWGNSAGGSYIRTIPDASQIGTHDGWASLTDGFPPLNFVPVGSGGIPPFGQDMNGILNRVTAWQQLQQAGLPTVYDSAFQTAIGGYPKGAVVMSALVAGVWWQSQTENNTTSPDLGGAGWAPITFIDPGGNAGLPVGGLEVKASIAGTGANILMDGGGATTPKKWLRVSSGAFQVRNNANSVAILSLADGGTLTLAGGLTANGNITATNGSISATFDISCRNITGSGNVAGTNVNAQDGSVTATYDVTAGRNVTANTSVSTNNGNITAQGTGKLRSANGVRYGSSPGGLGDLATAILLGDISFVANGLGLGSTSYIVIPGPTYPIIIQMGTANVTAFPTTITLPVTFPHAIIGAWACEAASDGWNFGGLQSATIYGTNPRGLNQIAVNGGRIVNPPGGVTFVWQTGISFNWLVVGF